MRVLKGSKGRAASAYVTSRFADSQDFPWNPDPLARGNTYDIYDEMRDDDQIKAALAIKKHIALSTGFEVCTEDEDVRAFWKDELARLGSVSDDLHAGFGSTLRDMLSCLDYGFSLTEPVFGLRDDGLWGIKALLVRPPHSFEFHIRDDGSTQEIRQSTNRETLAFKPSQFIHLAYQADFGNPYGKADLKAAHAPWKAKKFMDRFFAIYMERYAAPLVVGRYPTKTSAEEAARIASLLKDIQITTSLTLPDDIAVDFVQAQGDASQAFERAVNHYGLRIARAILVPDLIGASGEKTGGGSFALGDKQFQLFLGIIQEIRNILAAAITNRLVKPLTMVNFGDIKAEFKFLPYREDLMVENFRTWSEAVTKIGVKPSLEQINHLNKSLGFPESDEDGMAGVDAKHDASVAASEALANGDLEAPAPGKKPAAKPAAAKDDAEDMAWRGARKATAYEHKMDFAAVEKSLDKAERSVLPDLSRKTSQIVDDYLSQVRDSGLVPRGDIERLNALTPRFMRDLNRIWQGYFEDLFGLATDEAGKEILPRGTFRAPSMSEKYLTIIRAEAFKVVKDWSDMVTKRAKNVIIQGIKDKVPAEEMFRNARGAMKDESLVWTRTVVRTKTTEVYNEARKIYFETDPIASEIVVAYQWSAILDDRTSDVCRMLDGKVWEVGDDYSDRVKPPAHFNCRSVIVPITKFEKYTVDAPPLSAIADAGGSLISTPEPEK